MLRLMLRSDDVKKATVETVTHAVMGNACMYEMTRVSSIHHIYIYIYMCVCV